MAVPSIDWLINSLTDWRTDWLYASLIDLFIDWLIDWSIDPDWSTDQTTERTTDESNDRSINLLIVTDSSVIFQGLVEQTGLRHSVSLLGDIIIKNSYFYHVWFSGK